MLPTAQDAKKMPPLVQPRAEKRKLIEEELNCSLKVFVNLFVKEAKYYFIIDLFSRHRGAGSDLVLEPFLLLGHPLG